MPTKPRLFCFFCRKFKNDVKRFRLRFGEIHTCRECARELIPMLKQIAEEG